MGNRLDVGKRHRAEEQHRATEQHRTTEKHSAPGARARRAPELVGAAWALAAALVLSGCTAGAIALGRARGRSGRGRGREYDRMSALRSPLQRTRRLTEW